MPHPEFLRKLVREYETALAEETASATAGRSTRAQDLAYTLCVSTGTRDGRLALETARRMLAASAAPAAPAAPAAERRVPAAREIVPTPREVVPTLRETAPAATARTAQAPATA